MTKLRTSVFLAPLGIFSAVKIEKEEPLLEEQLWKS